MCMWFLLLMVETVIPSATCTPQAFIADICLIVIKVFV